MPLGSALLAWVAAHGYPALALGVMLENAGVPVPGETMVLTAAALSYRGVLSPYLVAGVTAIAAMLGDNIGFAVGRKGGRPMLQRWGHIVAPKGRLLERTDTFFERNGWHAVFFARFITGVRVVAALTAGASKMHWKTFVLANGAGAVVWASAVTALGYFAAEFGLKVAKYLHLAQNDILIVAGALLLLWLGIGLLRRVRFAGRGEKKGER